MYRLLLVLLLVSSVAAQQTPGEKTLEAFNFGTLETKAGPFNAKAGAATTYHNLDPSRYLGSLGKRWGYSEIDELNDGFDSLTGIYSAYLSDGRQFLVYAADSAGVGYGGLYITVAGEDSISNASRFWKYWSATSPTNFAMFDDKLYAFNGVQAGAVYNFDTRRAVRFPIQAPGEPIVVPLDEGDELDGEYRYMVGAGFTAPLGGCENYHSVVTQPVKVSSGRVLLTGFMLPVKHDSCTANDTVYVTIFRSRVNPGRLEQTDSFYQIITLNGIDTTDIYDLVVIDSIEENGGTAPFSPSDGNPWSYFTDEFGLDSNGAVGAARYGGPGYYGRFDTTYSLVTDSHKVGGIYHGSPTGKDTIGVLYAVTFFDTLNNIESDTGRSLYVSSVADTPNVNTWNVRLAMPRLPDSADNIVLNLYRSHKISVGRDTLLTLQSIRTIEYAQYQKWVEQQNRKLGADIYFIDGTLGSYVLKMRSITADTVLNTPYYLVEQINSDSVYFTDSTRYDSLVMQKTFRKTPPSTRMSNAFAYNGRMFGIDGSNLSWSLVDSASRWGAFDFISVNKDDGQRITLAYPTRRSIRVFKDASSYNIYQDGNGEWNLTEVTNGIGCIAPNSHAVSPAGHYYLSQDGVILETEGDYLERTYKTGLISANLDNFDKLPMSAKSKAVGTYFNHKYFITVPIAGAADTTYVWDELAQGWATWSMPIGGAAVYDTESVAGYAPGNSMYFHYPNGKTLYKYGNSLTDAGAYIWSNWTSTPFLTDEYEEAVSAIGVWFDDISGGDFIRFYDIVDGRDTVLSNLALFTDLGDTVGYREEAVASLRTGAYHQLAMWSTPDASGTWSRIDKINVSYLPLGKRTRFGETTAFVGGESGEGGAGTITFGDITGVIAGYGLSGGGLSGDVTLAVDTSVMATRAFSRDSAGIGVVPDSVLYADSSAYADTAGYALNSGSTDSFYVAKSDTTVIGWKQSGDTIFVDTSGGGGMTLDSTTAGNGLIEVANDLAVRPGFGIDTLADLVKVDTNEVVTLYRLEDTAAAVRANIRDTVTAMGIAGGMSFDSTTAGDGLLETDNDIDVVPGFGVLIRGDSVHADVAELDDSLMRIGTVVDSTTAGNGLIESANDLAVRPGFGIDTTGDLVVVDTTEMATQGKYNLIADDTVAFHTAKDSVADWDNGALDSTNLAANSVLSSEIAANTVDTSDMAHAPLGKLIFDSVTARGFLTSETGDISSVVAGTGMTGGATSGDATLNAIGKIYILAGADSLALDTAGLRTWAASLIVDSANGGAARAELADSATGAARAEIADSLTGFDENVADKVGAMVTGNTESQITVAYDDADNTLDFTVGVVDSATGAARAEVADSALHIDTTYAPLVALVNRHIRDTAAVMIEDSLDNYFLSAGDLDPDQLTGDATDNNLVDSSIVGGVSLSKLGSGGANSGEVPIWSGTAWVPDSNTGTLPANPDLVGSVKLQGFFDQMNRGSWFDTTGLYCENADTTLADGLRVPDTVIALVGADSNRFKWDIVHFNYVYIPWGLYGYKYHAVMTRNSGTPLPFSECVFYRVSNDGYTWDRLIIGSDTCPDPMFTVSDCPYPDTTCYSPGDTTNTYMSDPDIQLGFDGKLYIFARPVYGIKDGAAITCDDSSSQQDAIWVRSTNDGFTWNTAVNATGWKDIALTGIFADSLICPAVWPDTNASWKMVTTLSAITTEDSSSLLLWEAPKADSGWSLVGRIKAASDTTKVWNRINDPMESPIWHMDVIPVSADEQIWLAGGVRTGLDTNQRFYFGTSRDHGRSVNMCSRPFLSGTNYVGKSWDAKYLYKPAGVIMHDGAGSYIDLYYAATDTVEENSYWQLGRTRLYFDAKPFTSPLTTVHGRSEPPSDSVTLTFSQYNVDSTGQVWLFVDSTNQGSDADMAVVSGVVAGRPDSLIFTYKTSGSIDSIQINGPDLSNGLNRADSLWYSNTTARTSTSEARVAIQLSGSFRMVRTGDRFAVRFFMSLADDNDFVKVGSVDLKGYKR